jgi:polysaccharide biosynthesis protein PslH
MLRVLFLAHRLPFPPDRGDRIRSYHIIRYLARRHRVWVLAPVDKIDDAGLRQLRSMCEGVDVAALSRTRLVRAAGCVFTTLPLTVPMFSCRRLKTIAAQRLRSVHFDLVYIYCSAMASYLPAGLGVPWVIDFVDADSQKWLDYAGQSRFPMKAVYWREGLALRRYERRLAGAWRHAFVTSARDGEIVRRQSPGVPVTTIPNGVSLRPPADIVDDTMRLVFMGVMDYRPNVDAMTYFADHIFPLVRTRVPTAELVIVGQAPAPEIRRLASRPGITATGWVPDVHPHLQSAAAFVAPLRIARGIQNKILEAMAAGVPVVTTSTALGGIGAVPGRDVLVGDTPESFAAQTVRVLLDRDIRRSLGREGRMFVSEHHQWDVHLARLESVLVEVATRRES